MKKAEVIHKINFEIECNKMSIKIYDSISNDFNREHNERVCAITSKSILEEENEKLNKILEMIKEL